MATTEPEGNRAAQAAAPTGVEEPYPPIRYAWFVVAILMIVYIFSFIDRQILGLLVGPIQAEFGISDTQMGLLMGPSFAIFYTLFGLPMGRLADSRSRRTIIAVGLFMWSFFSAACGLARTYVHLLAARIGVGVGEATLSPSAYSLITDYFPPKKLAFAISVYGAGIYLGSGLAYLAGSYVVEFATSEGGYTLPVVGHTDPWQLVFFMIGLPGLAFTAFVYLIKEPARRGVKHTTRADGSLAVKSVPMSEVLGYFKSNRTTLICHTLGFAFLSFIGYGAVNWLPSFFVRVHGWEATNFGKLYGAGIMIFGTGGILFGGWLADRLANKGYEDAKMRASWYAAMFHIPFGIAFPLVPNGVLAYCLLLPATFTLAMPFGNAPAAIQEMMPNRMRGFASALYLFVVNIVGIGLGPYAVGLFTDYVYGDPAMVGYSLLIVGTTANVLSAFLLGYGLGRFRDSMAFLRQYQMIDA